MNGEVPILCGPLSAKVKAHRKRLRLSPLMQRHPLRTLSDQCDLTVDVAAVDPETSQVRSLITIAGARALPETQKASDS